MNDLLSKYKKTFTNVWTSITKVFTNIRWLEIPISVYVRWILAIILSINTVLTYFGINPFPFSEFALYELISITLNVVVLLMNTYKNNSTSKEALIADKIMIALKAAANSDEMTAIGKLHDILRELNGDNYINKESIEDDKETTIKDELNK